MLMWVRPSIPGTICPSSAFGPQALQTCPIVCVCPSRKWWVDMFFWGPKGSFINSTSRLFISLHVTEGGGCSCALCAVTSGLPLFVLLWILFRFYVWCHCQVTVGRGMNRPNLIIMYKHGKQWWCKLPKTLIRIKMELNGTSQKYNVLI